MISLFLFCCILTGQSHLLGKELDVDVVLEHAFNEFEFYRRSVFSLQLSKIDGKHSILDQENNGITGESIDKFKALLGDKNGLYRIRMRSELGNNTSPFVMVSIPACDLQKSGFKEEIALNLDITNSFIVGISYSSPVTAMPRSCDAKMVCF